MYSLLLIIAIKCKREKYNFLCLPRSQTSSSIVSLSDCFDQVYMGCETRKRKVVLEIICGNYMNFTMCKSNNGNQ